MATTDVIPFASSLWWMATGVALLVSLLLLRVPRLFPSVPHETWLAVLAVLLGINWVLGHVPYMLAGTWEPSTNLPLHLCGLSSLLAVVVLVKSSQLLSELLYYYGVVGGIHALWTPEFVNGLSRLALVQYYIAHVSIIAVPLLLMGVRGFRPRRHSWLLAFGVIQLLVLVAAGVNQLTGGNYFYLSEKPQVVHPLLIGEWPVYILVFELVALLHFLVLGIPFMRRWRHRPAGDSRPDRDRDHGTSGHSPA